MSELEFDKIIKILKEAGAAFESIEHEPVRTSQDAARVRGQRLSAGVKAIVLKFKREGKSFFVVCDVPADRKVDWNKAKSVLLASDIRMATPEEVSQQTGCEPGGVPPLGHKSKLALIVDPKVFNEETVEFNAGLTTKSVRMKSAELRKAFDSQGAAYFDIASE